MSETSVAESHANETRGSIVTVKLGDMQCSIYIMINEFSDKLPIIPKDSSVVSGKILYHLVLKATLSRVSDGKRIPAYHVAFKSDQAADKLSCGNITDDNGELLIVLETRAPGDRRVACTTADVSSQSLKITLKEAWYQSPFLITGYHICHEEDFPAELAGGNGLKEQHRADFLYSARGVPMQGTGRALDGRYIAVVKTPDGWHRNAKGNVDRVNNRETTTFQYVDAAQGFFNPIVAGHSIAVDPKKIPGHSEVYIDGLGARFADDTGGGIKGFHVDKFLGAGAAVVKEWMNGGVNGTMRRVKYVGSVK